MGSNVKLKTGFSSADRGDGTENASSTGASGGVLTDAIDTVSAWLSSTDSGGPLGGSKEASMAASISAFDGKANLPMMLGESSATGAPRVKRAS